MTSSFMLNESLSVIIPAYNEGGNISKLIIETLKGARKVSKNFEIIVIDDGSVDGTGKEAEKTAKEYDEVRVIHHKKNQGLALAWRSGIQAATKTVILYIEGDGQQPFKDQYDLLRKIKKSDLVLGVRTHRFDYTLFRKALSYGYLFLIWLLFGLKYKDVGWSQAYRRKIFEKVKMNSVTPFFDTEVVLKAKRFGYKIAEARSYYRCRQMGRTTLGNLKTAYKMFNEMVKMRLGLLD